MQRIVCEEYIASHPDWVFYKEKIEKGVSGFKVSAKDRDAIQEIQQEALGKKFDVLLVFMFDRIGRIDDETPFIVEWFVKNGIEVRSATEGQQRFESHVDKLMNYIRYWQASGESIKTSIRTKTRLGQMVEEGHFRGGIAPFGYRLEKEGRRNKKGHEVYEIMVDENEAAIVKMIFDKYLHEGYGSQRLSTYLTEQGIRNRKGNNFTNVTIKHMLKNESYMGILKSGDTHSAIFEELQIIDVETFMRVKSMIEQRAATCKDRTIPRHTQGKGLLSGNLFCGHCGARLVQTSSVKKNTNADGSPGKEYVRLRYSCYNKIRHKHLCDGQTGYTAGKVDSVIDQIMRQIFAKIKDRPQDAMLDARYNERMNELRVNVQRASEHLKQQQKTYDAYKAELLRVIQGESALDRATLNELLLESKTAVTKAASEAERSREALENGWNMYNKIRQ